MFRFLTVFCFCLLSFGVYGQDEVYSGQDKAAEVIVPKYNSQTKDTTHVAYYYCEIVGTRKMLSFKVNINISYGQAIKVFKNTTTIIDKDGKPMEFNSMIDALNFLGTYGWDFVQAYAISHDTSHVYHFFLRRPKLTGDEITDYLPTIKNN